MLSLNEVLALEYDPAEDLKKEWANYSLQFGLCALCGHRNSNLIHKNKMTEEELIILDMYLSIQAKKMPAHRAKMPKKIDGQWQSVCVPCAKEIKS